MFGQISRFALVGLIATLIHLLTGAAVIRLGVSPLSANLIAFITAFLFSFLGHHIYTFPDHESSVSRTFLRFAVTALLGFIMNETALIMLLWTTHLTALHSLFTSTAISAAVSFALSKSWVFRSTRLVG